MVPVADQMADQRAPDAPKVMALSVAGRTEPANRAMPVTGSRLSALIQLAPSALSLSCQLSSPASPISARPDQLVWNSRLAVSPDVALLSLIWWPLPAWVKRLASEASASRLVASALVLIPSRGRALPSEARGTQAPASNTNWV